jgi:hypothetical protein
MAPKHPSSRRYPPEVKQRAVQFVLTTIEQQRDATASSPGSLGSSTSARSLVPEGKDGPGWL